MISKLPRPRPPLLIAALLVVVGGLLAVALADRGNAPAERADTTAHALVGQVPEERMDRILHAVDAVNTETSRSALVAEGRRLFRTSAGVKPGETCAACHVDGGGANAEVGTITHPIKAGDFSGARDPLSLWGIAQTAPYGWAGLEPSLLKFVIGTIETHFANGTTQDPALTARQAAAITAYLQTLRPPVTDFDRGTLSAPARRGEALFVGKGACSACHGGPLLTDNALHNTHVPALKASDTDTGAAATGALKGAFDTPQLRDLRNTAPYMHNGSLKTLKDVVEFYNADSSLAPLNLTPSEIDDLVAYLNSL
jgi:mono/diheme cytochrome c family protein